MGLKDLFDQDARDYQRMARAHAKLWAWGLAHLKLFSPLDIADLGCGDGRNVAELLRMYPQAKVSGLDHAPQAVRLARKRNHGDIITKRCQIIQGDVRALPFADDSLDLATAFETIYFWPGPLESFREVYRALMPSGLFMICNKLDGEEATPPHWASEISDLCAYDKMTLIRGLKDAGFEEFSVDHNEEAHWLCIIARK